MRKIAIIVLSLLSIAAFGQVLKGSRVLINGKPFATAELLNGQWAVPLQDFAKAGGAGMTLEPFFQLRGSNLYATSASSARIKFTTTTKGKVDTSLAWKYRSQPGSLFHVAKSGLISSHVFMVNGKAFVPLADIAHAFGGQFNAPALKSGDENPTESLSLSFGKVENAYLQVNP